MIYVTTVCSPRVVHSLEVHNLVYVITDVKFGASKIFKTGGTVTNEDIDILLQRGAEKTNKQKEPLVSQN